MFLLFSLLFLIYLIIFKLSRRKLSICDYIIFDEGTCYLNNDASLKSTKNYLKISDEKSAILRTINICLYILKIKYVIDFTDD